MATIQLSPRASPLTLSAFFTQQHSFNVKHLSALLYYVSYSWNQEGFLHCTKPSSGRQQITVNNSSRRKWEQREGRSFPPHSIPLWGGETTSIDEETLTKVQLGGIEGRSNLNTHILRPASMPRWSRGRLECNKEDLAHSQGRIQTSIYPGW